MNDLDQQLDNYAITQDAARMAREANDELKKLETALRECRRLADEAKEDFPENAGKWFDSIYSVANDALPR